jgi:hypothetical protein
MSEFSDQSQVLPASAYLGHILTSLTLLSIPSSLIPKLFRKKAPKIKQLKVEKVEEKEEEEKKEEIVPLSFRACKSLLLTDQGHQVIFEGLHGKAIVLELLMRGSEHGFTKEEF